MTYSILRSIFIYFYLIYTAQCQLTTVWESLFKSSLDPERAKAHLKHLTSVPHTAGTPQDYQQALWMQDKFKEFGLPDVKIETYWPLLNAPQTQSLSLLSPFTYKAILKEKKIIQDPSSYNESSVPPFFGYGASGNVTAPLIYANFGTKKDFEFLKVKGIDVKGCIVIVRYGKIFRGLKVRAAELAGAVGVLIYSDPKEDGYLKGPVYPG
jgi:N-acetylated-alpha-linked acidic dipeptidase